jgi:NADH dehydrogenase
MRACFAGFPITSLPKGWHWLTEFRHLESLRGNRSAARNRRHSDCVHTRGGAVMTAQSRSIAGPRHVVVLGGGFGGLAAAQALKHAPVQVTLVDKNNHHLFQPLLYQVATAGLEASKVGFPLRTLFRRQANADVLMTEAESIDPASRTVRLKDGHALAYDYLIVATGAEPDYFGHTEWSSHAVGLKNLVDAMAVRSRVLMAFERAEDEHDPDAQRAELSFVVVGGGPTGVELAGAIAELARHSLRRDFRHIDPTRARVLLVEGGPAILPTYPEDLQQKALKQLESLGVEVWTAGRPTRQSICDSDASRARPAGRVRHR